MKHFRLLFIGFLVFGSIFLTIGCCDEEEETVPPTLFEMSQAVGDEIGSTYGVNKECTHYATLCGVKWSSCRYDKIDGTESSLKIQFPIETVKVEELPDSIFSTTGSHKIEYFYAPILSETPLDSNGVATYSGDQIRPVLGPLPCQETYGWAVSEGASSMKVQEDENWGVAGIDTIFFTY